MDKAKRACGACGLAGAPRRCPCTGESYCGVACQKLSWGVHKHRCTVFLSTQLDTACNDYGVDSVQGAFAGLDLGVELDHRAKYDDAARNIQSAQRVFRQLDLQSQIADSTRSLGVVYINMGRLPEALVQLTASLEIDRSLPDRVGQIGTNLNSLGSLHLETGDPTRALAMFQETLEVIGATDGATDRYPRLRIALLNNISSCYRAMRPQLYEKAFDVLTEALRIARGCDRSVQLPEDLSVRIEVPKDSCLARTLANLARTHLDMGRLDESLVCLEETLTLERIESGERSEHVARLLDVLATVYEKQHRVTEAMTVRKKALRYFKTVLGDDDSAVGDQQEGIGCLYATKRNYHKALILFESARKIYDSNNAPVKLMDALRHIGRIHYIQNQFAKAIGAWQEMTRVIDRQAASSQLAAIHTEVSAFIAQARLKLNE
jgi:tetratricopeptide (TPR) repeat protein